MGNSSPKGELIPHVVGARMSLELKSGIPRKRDLTFGEEFAAYQLVGEVTAHQGDDG